MKKNLFEEFFNVKKLLTSNKVLQGLYIGRFHKKNLLVLESCYHMLDKNILVMGGHKIGLGQEFLRIHMSGVEKIQTFIKEFDEFVNGEKFAIRISRDELIYRVSSDFSEVRRGEVLARFGWECFDAHVVD